MTGIGWLDAAAVAAFGTVTVLALLRLARGRARGLDGFVDDGFHAVMGVAMTAMFWPGSGRFPAAWIAVVGLIVVWPMLVLAQAARRSVAAGDGFADDVELDGGASDGGVLDNRASGGRVSLGHTGYWLTCTLLLVVAVGAGHGSAEATGESGQVGSGVVGSGMMASMPGSVHPAEAGIGASALGSALQTVAGWPIWPLVGIGFLFYAGLILLGRRRPITERVCAAVMAAGMAVMAFAI